MELIARLVIKASEAGHEVKFTPGAITLTATDGTTAEAKRTPEAPDAHTLTITATDGTTRTEGHPWRVGALSSAVSQLQAHTPA